ncbi:MAG: 16S rRNA (uracil(1498)-N(3))-methyltransferase [Clostridiaceae bacterium]
MHKFFVEQNNINDDIAIIYGEDVKHIYKVLRLKPSDEVLINNSNGLEYLGEILEIDKTQVKVCLKEKYSISNESNISVTLFQGIPKGSKLDYIVQKGVEVGINDFYLVETKRVIVKGEKDESRKLERLNKISKEAAKQSKRSIIPWVNSKISFSDMLSKLKEYDVIIVPYENKEEYGIKKLFLEKKDISIKKVAIIIGPEGGFEEEEINLLEQQKSSIVTLGPRILRTETAGVIAAAIVLYEIGDIGGKI